MGRYWRLIAVVVVVVLTIGMFYIQSAVAANELPNITVEKVSGNEKELEPVTISGSYSVGNSSGKKFIHGVSESFIVDAEGTTYSSEQSFFERIENNFYPQRINQLQEEYRGFMRGKSGRIPSFLETEKRIAYANIINQTVPGKGNIEFDIAVLNKENEETTSFTVPVPNRAMYHQVYVEDVQITDNKELQVITRNSPRNGMEELHLYRFDIENEDIIGEDTVVKPENQNENMNARISSAESNSDLTASFDDVIFKKTIEPIVKRSKQGRVTESAAGEQEYSIYNLETGEKRPLELPKELSDQEILDRDNRSLYFNTGQQIVQYDLESEQVTNQIELPSYEEEGKFEAMTHIADSKVYMLTRDQQSPQRLIVLGLETGDILFEGEIKLGEAVEKGETINLYDLAVQ
ncbi:hypothetical protein SAMN05216238_10977 [Lentibacillus persicus]|uniref:Uncharacterized protein n=1 Tax=Lentibacillus persicus TaxID=640948 RepID=A0A1I1YB91_9BACI|nr:hypothetical protein [Lentibacillus persicus]SFE16582.1 hypothetical protein SAMN05216238_10977 [Lentibacillus persicus]